MLNNVWITFKDSMKLNLCRYTLRTNVSIFVKTILTFIIAIQKINKFSFSQLHYFYIFNHFNMNFSIILKHLVSHNIFTFSFTKQSSEIRISIRVYTEVCIQRRQFEWGYSPFESCKKACPIILMSETSVGPTEQSPRGVVPLLPRVFIEKIFSFNPLYNFFLSLCKGFHFYCLMTFKRL